MLPDHGESPDRPDALDRVCVITPAQDAQVRELLQAHVEAIGTQSNLEVEFGDGQLPSLRSIEVADLWAVGAQQGTKGEPTGVDRMAQVA
jgi:hypothetical protein